MKKLLLLLLLACLSCGTLHARIGAVLNLRGEVINHSGRAQPVLKSFFGVELRSTSVNVAKVILEERYGKCLYEFKPSNSADSHSFTFTVFWYDQPVTAGFYFQNFKNEGWKIFKIILQKSLDKHLLVALKCGRFVFEKMKKLGENTK